MTNPSPEEAIAQLASRQYGVFSRRQIQDLGVGRGLIRHRLNVRRWENVAVGVFRLSGVPSGWRQALMIACLRWGDGAAISHRGAGALRGLSGFERRIVELTVPKHRRGRGPGSVHRNLLESLDVEIFEGIPVTTTARTLVDVAGVAPAGAVEEALDDALRRRLVTIAELRSGLLRVSGGGGRPGVQLMRKLLDLREGKGVVPQSALETKMLRILRGAGLPLPILQYPIKDGSRTVAVVDFAYPSRRLALETDGYRWHSGLARWQNDRTRRNQLTALDWRIVHVTWADLLEQPADVANVIGRMLRQP